MDLLHGARHGRPDWQATVRTRLTRASVLGSTHGVDAPSSRDPVALRLLRVRRLGYACRVMPGPFVDDSRVAQARGIASQVIEPVFDLIRRHPTISAQRTVLRLVGMSDAGPGGIPRTNLMTE